MGALRDGRRAGGGTPAAESLVGVFLLSTATLMFEITLTRLFSVAQFYHFAFMIVSLAMLGTGASGTWLSLRSPRWRVGSAPAWLSLGYGLSAVGAYLVVNEVPFDSFSIAWDWRQAALLGAQYFLLSVPFFCSGASLSLLMVRHTGAIGSLYAANLTGSAAGCALALALPSVVGGEGVIWVSGIVSGLAAVHLVLGSKARDILDEASLPAVALGRRANRLCVAVSVLLTLGCAAVVWRRPPAFALRLSPYKGLSYALQVPGATLVTSDWNGYSRVDLVQSPSIRSLPGLSYRYPGSPPPQLGLFVDGDELSPVLQVPAEDVGSAGEGAARYLPTSVAYVLRPHADVLVTAPRGGLEAWIALTMGADQVTVAEPNGLIAQAVGSLYECRQDGPACSVLLVAEEPRSYVRRVILSQRKADPQQAPAKSYDVVVLALTTPYRPIRSGAYSLGEDYRYTVEAFVDTLSVLKPDGLLVVSRWLQLPPSESLRAFALAVEAVERLGGDPAQQIVGFRGYSMMTLLVRATPFTKADLQAIRRFAATRAFDMVFAPNITASEVNVTNALPSPIYYETFRDLLAAEDREAWYAAYAFDVRPPTDDHPFFGHFFRWSQTRQIVAELGKSWQPFGGAGYFVLLALLALALVMAVLMIGLPAVVATIRNPREVRGTGPCAIRRQQVADLVYFGLLGIGFMFVEIPLIQRAILFLGHSAYAVTAVLFSLLLFSGVGSFFSARLSRWLVHAIGVLAGLVLLAAAVFPTLSSTLLWLPLGARAGVMVFLLGPVGVFMGIPFPGGLAVFGGGAEGVSHQALLARAWAANGALSVVASILSALLALAWGFRCVLILGALSYAGAAATLAWHRQRTRVAQSPDR